VVRADLKNLLRRSGPRFDLVARDSSAGMSRLVLAGLERARELAAIVAYSNDAVFSRRLDGTITTWNAAAERIFGFRAREVIGRGSQVLLPRGHRDEFRKLLARMRRGEVVRHFETERRRKDGRRIFVSLTLSPLRDGRGQLIGFSTIARDITRSKQLEREVLAISERERGAFSRELHDSLGQQLSGIAYLTNVLRERLREEGSPEAGSAERISSLLKQAIEQARAVARGLSPVRPEPEGLGAGLKELAAQTSEFFGVRCQFRYPRPVLVGDGEAANHLYRIAQEAVHNACRHGRATRVTIGLTRERAGVLLKIVDDGSGIGPLSPRRKGLGLHIMQYRAGLLAGTFSVRGRPAGGTEVCCVVPATLLQSRGSKNRNLNRC
jgi:two-component system, LuxR family, sensor kinase FixL